MNKITLVTGNRNKLVEIQEIAAGRFELANRELDLAEIQSLDLREIVSDKLRRAYAEVKGPVMVEDVAACLDSLNGLPGPFVKFFNVQLGSDALYKLAGDKPEAVTITCVAGYYDDASMVFGEGVIKGTITAPRGTNGFGFDSVVIPDGETRTMAEMTADEKNRISHRGNAFRNLLDKLEEL